MRISVSQSDAIHYAAKPPKSKSRDVAIANSVKENRFLKDSDVLLAVVLALALALGELTADEEPELVAAPDVRLDTLMPLPLVHVAGTALSANCISAHWYCTVSGRLVVYSGPSYQID